MLLLFYDPNAEPREWVALTALAVCVQFIGDGAISIAREYFALGVEPRTLFRPLGWTFFVDACLAPVGLAASLAGRSGRRRTFAASPTFTDTPVCTRAFRSGE